MEKINKYLATTDSGNQEVLKVVAIVLMLFDHIALISGDIDHPARWIGRAVFPLLAYLLVYNYMHNTRDKRAYIKRLFLFAILSQIPYMIAFENNELVLNIFFTLGVGLLLIYICEQWYAPVVERPWNFLLVWATVSFIFLFFSVLLSYGPFGIFTIFAFYLYIKEKTTISLLLLVLVIYTLNSVQWHLGLALFGLLSLAIIWLVNSRNIQVRRVNKWLYYTFYPLHLIFIKVGMLIV